MFGIKTHIKQKIGRVLLPQTDPDTFPEKGTSWWRIQNRLKQTKRELENRSIRYNLGSLYTVPHPAAVNAYKYFLDQNPNHLGNWTTPGSKPFATQNLEREVIWSMIDLYHADKNKIEGYITSGGTESNIFSTWVGRKYLEQHTDRSKICLLRTSLTHYSLRKSADIVGIPDHISPLNPKEWNLDQRGLVETVSKLYKEGYRGFLLPLTLGYTQTGTCDNVEETTDTVRRLQKELKDARFFLWIDAALNGLIAPFITDFTPFQLPLIQTIVVDFHKFGLVPFPASIVLYRKTLKKLIEQPIDYLSETDATLSGSRSGIPAASIWMMIHTLGKSGYRQLVQEQQGNKQFFIEGIKALSSKIQVITHPHSLSCGLILHHLKNQHLPQRMEEKYSLYPGKTNLLLYPNRNTEEIIYKCFFLPHLKKRIIERFLSDLNKAYK